MANSEATQKGLLGLGIRTPKISIVYPPVDLENFDFNIDAGEKKKEFNMCSHGLSFGIIGNLYEEKGQKIVLQAAVEVLKVFPHCRIFIIGDDPDGNDQYKKELAAYANQLGIGSNVIFTGFRRDIPELIQLLDSVVHASLFPEPFGKVIIEGMAMKKPVIATRSDGTTEIIDDGVNGFLIPPNDHKVLAQKLICVLRDENLRRKLGEAAFLKVKNYFTIEKHIKEVEKTYEGILKGSGQG
jgi:glycosyltransferase involved in cell wall biosynthesis